jgi:diaminopimelate decarboxylase
VSELAARYGTPLYVYRLGDVRAAAEALRRMLPDEARIYYSLKANPHPAVVAELTRAGFHSEVTSTAELGVALAAGQLPQRCLLTGPGKTADEFDDALTRGVRTFSLESETDYQRLAAAAGHRSVQVDIILRLNSVHAAGRGTGLRMTGAPTQFGMAPETAVGIARSAQSSGLLRPVGIHLFPATNVPTAEDLVAEFKSSIDTAATVLRQAGLAARLVDIGGGFAAPFARPGTRVRYENVRERLSATLDDRLPGWRGGEPRIAFESGRYLAGGCGSLLTTVLDVKTSGASTYVVLDAGVNALGGMSGLGRLMVPDAQPTGATPSTAKAAPGHRINLVGTLCTPLDVLSRSAAIPVPNVGDVLEIPNVGAYGLSASLLAFLSKPIPAEVVLEEDGSVVHVRRMVLRELDLGAGAVPSVPVISV